MRITTAASMAAWAVITSVSAFASTDKKPCDRDCLKSLADTYLGKLRRIGPAVLTRGADVPQWLKQLRLLRASWAERF